jgi:hypothetical protein
MGQVNFMGGMIMTGGGKQDRLGLQPWGRFPVLCIGINTLNKSGTVEEFPKSKNRKTTSCPQFYGIIVGVSVVL